MENTLMQVPGYFITKQDWDKILEIYGPLTNMIEFCLGPIEYKKLLDETI